MHISEKNRVTHELQKKIMLWIPALYFFLIMLAAIYSFKKPEYNWDMLAYMALILKMDKIKSDSIHDLTYAAAKQNLPAPAYNNLTTTSNFYRKKMSEEPNAFNNQLAFYVIKPLYIAFAYVCYKAGFSLPAATILPSVISYLLTGILLLYWLKKYLTVLYASLLSFFIMLSPPLLGVAKLSTPDALSAFLLLSSFYFLLEKENKIWMFIFMAASVFTRIDNIITCIAIISLMAFIKKISIRQSVLMLTMLMVCYFITTAAAGKYGWSIFYYNTFFYYISSSHTFHDSLLLKEYLQIMHANALKSLYYSHIIIFFTMVLSMFIRHAHAAFKDLHFDQQFSLLLVLIVIVRFILYPDIDDRSYIAFYLIALIFIIRKVKDNKGFSLLRS